MEEVGEGYLGQRDRCANESHGVELHLFEPVGEQAIHVIGTISSYFRSIIAKVQRKRESGFNFDRLGALTKPDIKRMFKENFRIFLSSLMR